MRETGSLQEKMIERNWVLKRKRKRISSGLDAANCKESHTSTSLRTEGPSFKKKLKGDIDIFQFGNKIKGHDGVRYLFSLFDTEL